MYCATRTGGYIQLRNVASSEQFLCIVSRNAPTQQVITSRWYCSKSGLAYKAYRKEILHLLTYVFEDDVAMRSQRDARAAADVPRPRSGRQHAG